MLGSRPILQMDAFPKGSTWKDVLPAAHPVKGFRVVKYSGDWLGRVSAPP
jgi:hypothetical protein